MTRQENNAESSIRMLDKEVVQDKYHLTYLLFYSLGTLTQVAHYFFITATDYWMYKFRDPTNSTVDPEHKTTLQVQFTANFSIVSSVCNIAFLAITLVFAKKISLIVRMIGSVSFALLMFLCTVIFVEIDTDSWQKGFFGISLLIGGLLTAASSVFMVSCFQLVAKFPSDYLAAILTGQSICGIFSALVQIFSLSIGASSQTSGLVYFLIGTSFVFLTLIFFLANLKYSEFFNYCINAEPEETAPIKYSKELLLGILNRLKYYMLSMFIVLGCSITIHPGVTSLVQSSTKNTKWADVYFTAVATFLLYNVTDYVGREMCNYIRKPRNGIFILFMSTLRITFVPMLMFCNAHPRNHLPVAFNADWIYMVLIAIFGYSNGYLVNLSILQIPNSINPEEKQLAMGLIVILMIVSLGMLSFMGPVLIKAL